MPSLILQVYNDLQAREKRADFQPMPSLGWQAGLLGVTTPAALALAAGGAGLGAALGDSEEKDEHGNVTRKGTRLRNALLGGGAVLAGKGLMEGLAQNQLVDNYNTKADIANGINRLWHPIDKVRADIDAGAASAAPTGNFMDLLSHSLLGGAVAQQMRR